MKVFFASLYGRIAAIFLVLLLTLSLAQLAVNVQTARNFSRESDQGLNKHLARDLVKTFQPALREGLDREAIAARIHDLMIYNPRVEIYLLDADGRVLGFFSEDKPLARQRVRLAPVREFLSEGGPRAMPIYGDDPRSAEGSKPFSAAPIRIGERPGYLYLILGGEQYESIAAMVEESYIIRNGVISLLATFLLIGLAGLVIFFGLTRRLRSMMSVVRAFEGGDYGRRVVVQRPDEVGQLGRAFNEMADRVEGTMERLRHADRQRRELVANVSHDLRSPLASIQGYLETVLMKDAQLPVEERRRFLEIIHAGVLRLGALVNELFELSKLEAEGVRPRLEPFPLSDLVQDVVMKFQPQADDKRLRLTAEYPRELPFVQGDIGMIERVLANLIENALRYTPAGGRVAVILAPEGGRVQVRVADTGPGIPSEDLPHLFERFYRVDKSRARHSGGSGLGLAIARHILELHDSSISVERSSSAGTVFVFELAASPPGPPSPNGTP